jgi:hypothetical protein
VIQIYEVVFKGFSYGLRPGRSPHQALDALYVDEVLIRSCLDEATEGQPIVPVVSVNLTDTTIVPSPCCCRYLWRILGSGKEGR